MNKTTEAFEAWWADIGEQSLFALNTTTDDDIKILAGIAWEAAIRDVLAAQDHIADAGNKVSDHIAGAGKVIPQFIPVGIVNDHHSITWMEEIVDDQAPIGAILYALQDSVGRNVSFVDESVCNWRQPTYDDAECNAWQADCDQYWAITEGTPTENGMKFCHGCGKSIKVHSFVDSEDEQ